MTELETQLLTALTQLESEFRAQNRASEKAQTALREMFEATSQENKRLQAQVMQLNSQVNGLIEQLQRLSRR